MRLFETALEFDVFDQVADCLFPSPPNLGKLQALFLFGWLFVVLQDIG